MSVATVASRFPRVLASDWIPLRLAALCISCETTFPLAAVRCPACDGSACMPLEKWLKTVKPGS